MVPMIQSQKFHINLQKELDKVWSNNWPPPSADPDLIIKSASTPETNKGLFENVLKFIGNKLG